MPDGELDDVETQTTTRTTTRTTVTVTVQNPAAADDAIETMSGTVTVDLGACGIRTLPAQALKNVTASLSGVIFFFGVLAWINASTLTGVTFRGLHYNLIIILHLLGTVSTVVAMFAPQSLKGTPLEPHTALIPMVAMGLFGLAFWLAIYGLPKGHHGHIVVRSYDYNSFIWARRFYGTDASRNTMIILLFMLTP
jgi:hypothetical protein